MRSSKAEAEAPALNELNDPCDEPNDPVRLETGVTRQLAEDASVNCNEGDPVANERAALLTDFKLRGRRQGIRITDEMVAKAANPRKWNDRTMVTWWKRNDSRCKLLHDKKIRAVLSQDPSTIWTSNSERKRLLK